METNSIYFNVIGLKYISMVYINLKYKSGSNQYIWIDLKLKCKPIVNILVL